MADRQGQIRALMLQSGGDIDSVIAALEQKLAARSGPSFRVAPPDQAGPWAGGYEGATREAPDQTFKAPSLMDELGEQAKQVGSTLWSGAKAVGSSIAHPIDTVTNPAKRRELERGVDDMVTLGYGQKLADKIGTALGDTPDQQLGATAEADAAAAPGYRTAGGMVGIAMPGAAGSLAAGGTKLAGKVIGPGATVVREGIRGGARGVLGYEASAPLTAGLHADAEGHRLDTAKAVATNPIGIAAAGTVGAGAAATGKVLSGAPARAEESELAGLGKEGIQYKSRMTKFEPNEAEIRAQLGQRPDIRSLIKSNPLQAQPLAEQHLATVADEALNPIYSQLKATGKDGVRVDLVVNQLRAARAGFDDIAEEAQLAVIDRLIEKYEAKAAANNGVIPADAIRQTATKFQKQGHANVPMIGPVQLSKAMKQDVGNALRGAIGDHIESLADNTASGKALREAFTSANRDVSTWYKINDLLDEKVSRLKTGSIPMGDAIKGVTDVIKHPILTAAKVAAPAADAFDRRVLAPAVRSPVGQALAPAAGAAADAAPTLVQPAVIDTLAASRRRAVEKDAERAAKLKRGGR